MFRISSAVSVFMIINYLLRNIKSCSNSITYDIRGPRLNLSDNLGPFVQGGEGIRRSLLMEGDQPITYYYHDACTLYELFLRGLRESSEFRAFSAWRQRLSEEVISRLIWDLLSHTDNGPCLGSRKPNQPYEWQSYREVSPRTFPDWHIFEGRR